MRASTHRGPAFILRAGAVVLALGLAPAAWSQVTPMSVNDCTLLPDPGALRRCLDQAEGRVAPNQVPAVNPAGSDRPAQEAQSVRAGSAAAPAGPQPNFLDNRPNRPKEPRPPKRNVIDLD